MCVCSIVFVDVFAWCFVVVFVRLNGLVCFGGLLILFLFAFRVVGGLVFVDFTFVCLFVLHVFLLHCVGLLFSLLLLVSRVWLAVSVG